MGQLTRPPSLRTFLDEGCDITVIPGWQCLAESVFLHRLADPGQRRREMRPLLDIAEEWLTSADRLGQVKQDHVTRILWEAECSEDPELAARFKAALPADTRAELDEMIEVMALDAAVWPGEDPPGEWPGEADR